MAFPSWALPALLFCFLTSATAHAQDAALSVIAERSDAIVLARCVETRSHWDEDARVIVTDVTLDVERSFKGGAATTIAVRTLGGRVGPVGMEASHTARFAPGARVVALLRRSRFGPYFVITSTRTGVLRVVDDPGGDHVAVGGGVMGLDDLATWLGAHAP